MADEGQFMQRVLGKRLTYLSEHAGVRQAIFDRMVASDDPVEIICSLEVGEEYIDLIGTKKQDFIDILDRLMPGLGGEEGAGKKYEREADDDTDENREHAWEVWYPLLRRPNGLLHEKLTVAITQLLSYEKRVKVSGDSDSNHDVIWRDSNNPRLIFQVPREYLDKG